MSKLVITDLAVNADERTVVSDTTLVIESGKIALVLGPNGSGKSSLLNAIMGHPKYKVVSGTIRLDEEDITTLPTEKKAQKGIFLSLQHLPEIAGVTLTNFLHKAYRAQKDGDPNPAIAERASITPLEFYKKTESLAKEFGIDPIFLKKHINSGLSGGEKKQSEVLQLLALEPKFALLDEIDSGVDVDSLKKIFAAIVRLQKNGVGFLLVSHHPQLLEHVTPDTVYVMKEGRTVATGGKELAEKIASRGFENI